MQENREVRGKLVFDHQARPTVYDRTTFMVEPEHRPRSIVILPALDMARSLLS
jgi:hypothetical protein